MTEHQTENLPPWNNWPNDPGFDYMEEQKEPKELAVQGIIPAVVAGTLFRIGPGSFKPYSADSSSSFRVDHWFDGFTLLHRFTLVPQEDGTCKVFYNSRRQCDRLMEQVRETGRLEYITFGQKRDPCDSWFKAFKSSFLALTAVARKPGYVNVGVTVHPNMPGVPHEFEDAKDGTKANASTSGAQKFKNLSLLTDATFVQHVNADTLEPYGITDQSILHPELVGKLSCAHAQFDPVTGDMYNYNLDCFGPLSKKTAYRIFRVSAATGETEIVAKIEGPQVKGAYLHSFLLSEDFVILVIWPCHYQGSLKFLFERNMAAALAFDPTEKTRWFVVDRKNGRGVVAEFESEPFFCFHTINAYQVPQTSSDGKKTGAVDIVCDLNIYPDDEMIKQLYYKMIISTSPDVHRQRPTLPTSDDASWRPEITRFRLAGIPTTGRMEPPIAAATHLPRLPRAEKLASVKNRHTGELPTINPLFTTKKARFVYNPTLRGVSSFFDGLAKVDVDTGKCVLWGRHGHTPGEAIFVPDPAGEAEDDGYLLSVVLEGATGESYLLCLDARTMQEVGRAECGVPVPFGFHGAHGA